ncbi:hypothetical protein AVEN_258867-1 [Araneus ventricosus]|uniref:Uncharacterized protein n=1 Tax=Araneus ventricosus TaxID=182803 RepID=A0A4Y2V1G0_ARAVE|nr:hypothetical protein AVEN_258867-1 [Araneus ventricosus]
MMLDSRRKQLHCHVPSSKAFAKCAMYLCIGPIALAGRNRLLFSEHNASLSGAEWHAQCIYVPSSRLGAMYLLTRNLLHLCRRGNRLSSVALLRQRQSDARSIQFIS